MEGLRWDWEARVEEGSLGAVRKGEEEAAGRMLHGR